MTNQKGIAHLLLLVIVVALIALGYYLYSKGLVKSPLTSKQAPKVEIKTEYKNPLKKQTQYVNPFDQYKSPLVNLKK